MSKSELAGNDELYIRNIATIISMMKEKKLILFYSILYLTSNLPVVYMAQDVMILMGANPYRGPVEGVGPEN